MNPERNFSEDVFAIKHKEKEVPLPGFGFRINVRTGCQPLQSPIEILSCTGTLKRE